MPIEGPPLTIFWHLERDRPGVFYSSHFMPFPNSPRVQSSFSLVLPILHNRITNFLWNFSKLCFIYISGKETILRAPTLKESGHKQPESGRQRDRVLTGEGRAAGGATTAIPTKGAMGTRLGAFHEEEGPEHMLVSTWRNWNPHTAGRMQNDAAIVEKSWCHPQTLNTEFPDGLTIPLLVHTQGMPATPVQICSEQHYSKWSKDGKN